MGFSGDVSADLFEMKLHGFGICKWQHKGCTCASGRADGPEQVGVLVTLIGGK
jgi:hypothetical protein